MSYSVAIIGTGRIAGLSPQKNDDSEMVTHARVITDSREFELMAAFDQDPKRLGSFVEQWGVPEKFSTLDELLDSQQFDLICVASIAASHYETICSILQRGDKGPRVLFVEKPIVLEPEQFHAIEALALGSETKLIVNHSFRFSLNLQFLAKRIAQGEWGKLLSASGIYYGGLLNNGTHMIDLLRLLLNDSLKVESASLGAPGRNGDDCFDALMKSLSAPVTLRSFDERYFQLFELELIFERGRLRVLDFAKEIYIDKVVENQIKERELKNVERLQYEKVKGPLFVAYTECAKFLNGKESNMLNSVAFEEVKQTMEMVWSVKEAALQFKG